MKVLIAVIISKYKRSKQTHRAKYRTLRIRPILFGQCVLKSESI